MRMMKCWRDECNVPLESFIVEQVVAHFMADYVHRQWGYFWYDWFARDFLIFLIKYSGGYLHMPGTYDVVMLGNEWLSRAETARERALKACHYEYVDATVEAGEEWQKIFGPKIPIHVL